MDKFIIEFIILSIINVVFSTVKSIATIKGGKISSSLISGAYFAFYNIMLIYTVQDFDMIQKCVITFVCNVFGVFIVKYIEEKLRKDKLWKVEVTVNPKYTDAIHHHKRLSKIPHNYVKITKKIDVFYFYCRTKEESKIVRNICEKFNAKFFVSENQNLF